MPRTFLWPFSQTFSLFYSSLNSATLSCSSEVTLIRQYSLINIPGADFERADRSYDGTFIGLNEIKNEAMDDIKEESCFTDDPLNVGVAVTKEKK